MQEYNHYIANNPKFRRGFMLILSSPSGAGKTTLSRKLLAGDKHLIMSVSATTRTKRKGEVEGEDYFFTKNSDFQQLIKDDKMLEYAEVFGNYYGTPSNFVNTELNRGIDILFDIDWQGTRQLVKKCRKDMASIFILPPSMEELERRLRSRGLDDDEIINSRMQKARTEIEHWNEYDYVVINRDIHETLAQINSILNAERIKRNRQINLDKFVKHICG